MARRKRRRHSRRSYGSLVSMPSLGGIKEYNPLGKTVRSTDVAVGALVGMIGGMGVKYALAKLHTTLLKADGSGGLPKPILDYMGPISTFGAGVLAYAFQRKRNKLRGTGHLVGATLAAAVPVGWQLVRAQFPTMADYVSMELGGLGGYGYLVENPVSISGLIVDNPGMAGLEGAAMAAMAEEDS